MSEVSDSGVVRVRRRSPVVEAMQYDGKNGRALQRWTRGAVHYVKSPTTHPSMAAGWVIGDSHRVSMDPGDWITHEGNEFFWCRDAFDDEYERVADEPEQAGEGE